MTRDELKEKVAADAWERMRQENIRENDDDLGPWFTPNPEWEDLPEPEHEAHYLRLPYLVDASAAIDLVLSEAAKVANEKRDEYEEECTVEWQASNDQQSIIAGAKADACVAVAAAILTLTGEK